MPCLDTRRAHFVNLWLLTGQVPGRRRHPQDHAWLDTSQSLGGRQEGILAYICSLGILFFFLTGFKVHSYMTSSLLLSMDKEQGEKKPPKADADTSSFTQFWNGVERLQGRSVSLHPRRPLLPPEGGHSLAHSCPSQKAVSCLSNPTPERLRPSPQPRGCCPWHPPIKATPGAWLGEVAVSYALWPPQ